MDDAVDQRDEALDQRDEAGDELHTVPVSEDVVVDSPSSDPIELDIDGSSSNPVDEDLVGVVVSNGVEAYELYNNYAYRVGFSVRKGNQRCKVYSKTVQMKMFMCSKAGFKVKANAGVRAYSKIDTRSGCGACVQFDVGEDGLWTVTKHVKVHNHELCAVDKSHLLRSHRNVGDNQLLYLKDLKKSGVAMADGIRFLKHQAGGSPLVGFTNRDAYNSIASDTSKRLDGTDSNSLIEIFRKRQSTESDFFFDFETIMTDQCASMAAAICQVFPTSRHRLCIWHIGENSKKHIKALRNNKDFLDMFNCVLKYTETEAEFEFYWTRLVTDYKCHKNSWIQKLYDCREKWCPAFNKDYFSGGILSSQRSETTNHSISRRLSKTAGLCDFYSSFVSVTSEWRSKENGEDFRCTQGVPNMMMEHVKLLLHAREVYTIEIYFLFEEQFMKGNACHQEMVLNEGCQFKYHVWRPDIDIIRHEVSFKLSTLDISCSCKLISELGILCCHCLRILHIHCVSSIPNKYIMKRWTKKVADGRDVNTGSMFCRAGVPPSIWVVEICRNGAIQNPSNRRSKGERNVRRSSVIEKKYSAARGRRSAANKVASSTKGVVQSLVLESLSEIAGDGYLVHPSSGSSEFCQYSNDVDDNAVVD
ncbi:PREDICTED: protein FAR1-RELATED SEQUENCE 5-like [Ipomoea nil]|uniref:protein FAR1-RELATED SEQUENCE 5-like n=1 Tax=Ipomoea nil TaxID=35883 RepID=UPI000900C1F7|nr:PREDICTED: protein FAR1-RELATED SEQUENCE 5-like [Ipomoea nil]